MVVKIYISGISGNKEVKKRQQRVLMILDSKTIKYEVIDITEPGKETDKEFMQNNSKSNGGTVSDPNPRSPLPPQMFNDEEYCGDYDQFDLANEVDTLEEFLKLEVPPEEPPQVESVKETTVNGDLDGEKSKEGSQEPETNEIDKAEIEITTDRNKSPVKENTPLREDVVASKEGSPTINESEETTKPEKESETNVETKASPERKNSFEKTESPEKEVSHELEPKEASKESSPEKEVSVNENGTVSSREQSEEKQAAEDQTDVVERKKDNPSELLIKSEQAATAE